MDIILIGVTFTDNADTGIDKRQLTLDELAHLMGEHVNLLDAGQCILIGSLSCGKHHDERLYLFLIVTQVVDAVVEGDKLPDSLVIDHHLFR